MHVILGFELDREITKILTGLLSTARELKLQGILGPGALGCH